MPTNIEWVRNPDGSKGETWNPIRGTKGMWHCTPVSPGCLNCYASRMNTSARFGNGPAYKVGADEFRLAEEVLRRPRHWRKPRRIFVCSMSDLFHEDIPSLWQASVIKEATMSPQHTLILLTKRAARMSEFFNRMNYYWKDFEPFHNVWAGVSVESQGQEGRLQHLVRTPSAVRFISYEPALGPLSLRLDDCLIPEDHYTFGERLDWCIAGCESGPKRRPADPDWFRSLRDQCVEQDIPFFLKQMDIGGEVVKMPELDGVVHDAMPDRLGGDE